MIYPLSHLSSSHVYHSWKKIQGYLTAREIVFDIHKKYNNKTNTTTLASFNNQKSSAVSCHGEKNSTLIQ